MAKYDKFCKVVVKRNDLKGLMKKLSLLQMYYLTVGIHTNEGRRISNSRTKSKSNIAKVAHIMESGATYTQSKTVRIPSAQSVGNPLISDKFENFVTILKGTLITIPQRIFISLNKLPFVWNKVQAYSESLLNTLMSQNMGTGNASKYYDNMGKRLQMDMMERIGITGTTFYHAPNSPTTIKIKGFNHPLFDTGKMLNSIKWKRHNNYGSGEKKLTRLKYLNDIKQAFEGK